MIQAIPILHTRDTIVAKAKNYVQVGLLLHAIGVCSALTSAGLVYYTFMWVPSSRFILFGFLLWLASFFFMNALLSQLDALSRYQNFKQVRDQLYKHGYQKRIVMPLAKSSCQRVAAVAASKRLGLESEVKNLYKSLGYKWHNILPDFIKSQPLFFFHPAFWRSTFFVKYYKSKYF